MKPSQRSLTTCPIKKFKVKVGEIPVILPLAKLPQATIQCIYFTQKKCTEHPLHVRIGRQKKSFS